MNDETAVETKRPRRFILFIWNEARECDQDDGVLRGSIQAVRPEGALGDDREPDRVYFETLAGIAPALRRLLAR